MASKTITGSYPSGYALNPSYDTLNVASTATVGGVGVTTTNTQPSTINNLGSVQSTANGITLSDGGTLNNTGSIGGTSPVVVTGAAGTVHNYGNGIVLRSNPIFSANYSVYGTNDGSYYRRPGITMTKGGSVTNDVGGRIDSGISIAGGPGAVVNNGYVGGPELYHFRYAAFYGVGSRPFSIELAQGTVTNGSESNTSATIAGGIFTDYAGPFGSIAIQNFGTIKSAGTGVPVAGYGSGLSLIYTIGDGIHILTGSVVNGSENDRAATIYGYTAAVVISSGGTFTNFGKIAAGDGGFSAFYSNATATGASITGGTLTNGSETDRTALITADTFGISLVNSSATNFGTIESTYSSAAAGTPAGAVLRSSTLTNGSASDTTALISGVVGVSAPAGTITNFGTIQGTGGTAVTLGAKTGKLVEEGSGVLDGNVLGGGGILELAGDAGAGTLSGLGSTITGFGTVTVDMGATWTFSGTSTVAKNTVVNLLSNVINSGTFSNQAGATLAFQDDVSITPDPSVGAGQFINAGLVEKLVGTGTSMISTGTASLTDTGTIDVETGTLELTGAAITVGGPIKGAGTIEFGADSTTLQSGTSIKTAGWTIAGTGADVTVANSISYVGAFTEGANTELTINLGDTLTLSGAASVTGATVDGAGRITTSGATALAQVVYNGSNLWQNSGTVTETGQFTLGDVNGQGSVFSNVAGGVFDIAVDVGITGTLSGSTFRNAGLLAKTTGTGVSTIAAALTNTGTIEVASGTLDLQQGASGVGGTLKIDAGKTLQIDGAVSSGQTVGFNGGGDKLVLTAAQQFSGTLQNFGAGDQLDLRQFDPATTTVTFSEKADNSGGTLTVTNGALTAKIQLSGQYTASGFHISSDGVSGGSSVTYTGATMSSKTITGSYPSGYALNPSYDTLNVASTATVGGAGITTTTTQPSTINNLGSVQGTANGITLSGGGTIFNGGASNTTALIEGVTGIVADNVSAIVKNYTTIKSDAVASGSFQNTGASIILNQGGAVVNQSTGQIVNGVSISGASGAVTNIGTIGSPTKTQHTSQTYNPPGYGGLYRIDSDVTQASTSIRMSAGGSVSNGAGTVNSANISNGISITGGTGVVSNFGTVGGARSISSQTSFYAYPPGQYGPYGGTLSKEHRSTNESNGAAIVLSAGTITNASGAAINNGIELGAGKVVNNGSINNGPTSFETENYYEVGGTVQKFFTFAYANYAISVAGGGSVTNGSVSNVAATIYGGVQIAGGVGTIVNQGSILGGRYNYGAYYYRGGPGIWTSNHYSFHGYSARLTVGGQVTNGAASNSAATIDGIYITGGVGNVTNFGTIKGGASYYSYLNNSFSSEPNITSRSGYSIKLTAGGSVTNGSAVDTQAAIENGVFIDGGAGQVSNYGIASGISLQSGGIVTNGSAKDAAAVAKYIIIGGAGTVTNFGTIQGGISLNSSGSRLIEEGTGVLEGGVTGSGGTLELAGAAGAGTLTGLGSTITGFATVTVDKGASWSLSGTSNSNLAAGATLTNNGTLNLLGYLVTSGAITNAAGATLAFQGDVSITTDPSVGAGQFVNTGLIEKLSGTGTSIIRTGTASLTDTGTIDVETGTLALTGATVTIVGPIKGAGTIQLGVGTTTLQSGTSIKTAGWTIAGTGADVIVGTGISYAGTFAEAAHTELTINLGDSLALSGAATFTGATVDGAGRITTSGATNLAQLVYNGSNLWQNSGTVTETGQFTLGGVNGQGSVFSNLAGSVFDIAGNVGIAGTVASSTFRNAGLLAKTTGTGVSTIAAAVTNTGTIEVASGTLDLQQGVGGVGGVLQIDAGKTLQTDAAVSSGQTVDFNGGNDKLVLTDATHFLGTLKDFGSADKLDLRQFDPVTTTVTFSEKADNSGGTLTVTNGALTAKIQLLGQYMASGFHTSSDGVSGGTFVTYTPPEPTTLALPHS